ncbi:glycoside hydrolase family 3 C-terminal domain-containing protein [Amycolatopsis roodepoortensis]|uniref:beta-glucosidase H n=1 Tax=Amycolatopsis roodepoortensis TaxID=700274 RepID=UPI00214BA118|nr:glycoside hydrolase family 3 C-terminal domain-containing protein [Amycolatopsis roodepoortensis]UUV31505.1 glycoside hydrolase family 3 C-terminal domain-containing protein [Amycolatopsis roodepoortensis]
MNSHHADHGAEIEAAIDAALPTLGLDVKARLVAGQGMWSLPALPEIGLRSLVMSDGPIGVRGVRWTAADPSIALPSPTAMAATWDPGLIRRAGHLLAQEARRKGVHVLLAPTVNLHRSPLGGRHFECYSEDPFLTGAIGTGYVRGVQEGGVGTTVKHFVANDAETDRFTVDNLVDERTLRELYLTPFEMIVAGAKPWGVMAAYNSVNGPTMTEHDELQNGVLRGEWGFDGAIVSDWFATRSTTGAIGGGLDIAMPGPHTVYGEALAAAVRAGEVEESTVDNAVRRVLRLAARTGAWDRVAPAVAADELPAPLDGVAMARELAGRAFVLLRNRDEVLPLDAARHGTVALIGAAARDARVLGGGSAQVFPEHVVSPLEGLRAALPEGALTYRIGADPTDELSVAGNGFELRAVCRDAEGTVLGEDTLPHGMVQWFGSDLPEGVTLDRLRSVEITGRFTPRESGLHSFGTKGLGAFTLSVDGTVLFDGVAVADGLDPFEAFFAAPAERAKAELVAGKTVEVGLVYTVPDLSGAPVASISCALVHREPQLDADELIEEAVAAASVSDAAIVVVATTERVESEGFDRADLRLPGRQDELVHRVAAVNPRTIVVVNAGSPVEMPWRDEVAAVMLSWFPGQEGGSALADVLLGDAEPGGRLPTTWPVRLDDAPVTQVRPRDGKLSYDEGVFIGYRAWQRGDAEPAYWFGHGLGYTDWSYEDARVVEPDTVDGDVRVMVTVRNSGIRDGREVVQVYASRPDSAVDRPHRWLAGFATVECAAGARATVDIALPQRVFAHWDGAWTVEPGEFELHIGRSAADIRLVRAMTPGP